MEFRILDLEKKKLIVDYTAKIELKGKSYEAAVRFINFMDGTCEYHINGRTIPVDGATFHAINQELIDKIQKGGSHE